jgi:hypothetical protein
MVKHVNGQHRNGEAVSLRDGANASGAANVWFDKGIQSPRGNE